MNMLIILVVLVACISVGMIGGTFIFWYASIKWYHYALCVILTLISGLGSFFYFLKNAINFH